MDTLGFLRAILPDAGIYYAVLFKDGHPRAHIAFKSLEGMASRIQKLDASGADTVYHACSSFREPFVVEPNGKRMYRKPGNWRSAKALWIDVDCGADKAAGGKGYPDKKSAWAAIAAFCDATKLPRPMIVDSGNGLHAYWTLTKAIKPATWLVMANNLRIVLEHFKVLVDPSRTKDFASVLRPPGTTNRKGDPKPVVVRREMEPLQPELLHAQLVNIVKTCRLTPAINTGQPTTPGINDALIATSYQKMDSSAVLIADRCAQVRLMRDTKGDVGYDHWRGVIGLIKHCTEGISLAREWTENRAATGHDSVDVLTRYETWSAGPTTCEFFSRNNPGLCDGCPSQGKIKSPIVLGRVVPEPEEQTQEAKVDGETVQMTIPEFPPHYKWENNAMVRYIIDKDKIWHPHEFCRSLFYPIRRVRNEAGSFSMGLRVHLPDKRIREVDVETGLLASPAKLMEALGHGAEIVQMNTPDAPAHLTAYLRDSLEQLKTQAEELHTMTSFGWKEDMQSFLIGDRLYLTDGTMRHVLVGGYAADYLSSFPEPRGTVEGYAKAVNYIYSREGMEPLQYALCSGFGSILTPLGESLYNGLLVSLTGGESARGKTTVAQMAMNAFGDAAKMTLGTERGATVNAMFAKMGTYGSIPVLFDEYTNVEAKDFSEFAYRISQGTEKERLTSGKSGTRKAGQVTWKMSPYVTANKDLHGLLSTHSANSQAEAVRMIQIKIDEYDTHQFSDNEVASALHQTEVNSGVVGELFIRHVVSSLPAVSTLFEETSAELAPQVPGPRYRYYRNHATTVLTAAKLLNSLGVTTFDITRLATYTVRLLRKLCDDVTETNMIAAEDALSIMINDLTPRIFTTVEFRDGRDARGPEMVNRQYQSVAGRYITGNNATKKEKMHNKLLLSRSEVKTWCMKQRVELRAMLAYAKAQQILVDDQIKLTLTRGTELSPVNLWCVVLDMDKMTEVIGSTLKLVASTNGTNEPGVSSMT